MSGRFLGGATPNKDDVRSSQAPLSLTEDDVRSFQAPLSPTEGDVGSFLAKLANEDAQERSLGVSLSKG